MTVYIKFDPSDAKMYDSRSSSSDDYVVDLYLGENLSFLGHFSQVLASWIWEHCSNLEGGRVVMQPSNLEVDELHPFGWC